MNQRYRNDNDYGRRVNEREPEHRYAQPRPDARFDRERYPRDEIYREEKDYFGGDRNRNDWGDVGANDYDAPRNNESAHNQRSGNFAANGYRSGETWRGREENPWRSAGYRDYGSNRDYSRPAAGGYGDHNPVGSDGHPFDGRKAGPFANRSLGDNGRQASAFYLDPGSQQRRGEHFGKGPKGYQRSDERIQEDVCDRLAQDDALDARNITVTTSSGEVTLEGSVPDRFSKHRAEDIVDSVTGVSDINNRLKVDQGFLDDIADRLTGTEDHSGHAGERPNENRSR